jgi:peptidoglycan/xylan/chitin deacetylase (PgdA/CDA1 family)
VSRALLLLYHDIGGRRSPLSVSKELFEAHLDELVDAAAVTMTVSALADAFRAGRVPQRAVCLTFDDAYASVHEEAAPRLLERGLVATVFCVAGYLGRTNDWPTQTAWVERRPLASPQALADLAAAGFELGAHGYEHHPLARAGPDELRREVIVSREALVDAFGVPVDSFAYAYGSLPRGGPPAQVRATYRSACTVVPRRAGPADDLHELPRVDAHYLRRPTLLRRAMLGRADPYLALRRAGRLARELTGIA